MYEPEKRRRIGDPFRAPSLRDVIKKRYLCVHVKAGAPVVVRLDTAYGIVAACERCKNPETMRITDDCQVV